MQFIKSKLKQLVHSELVKRAFHTFWQATAGVLVASLLTVHSSADVKSAIVVAVAAGLAALKAAYLNSRA